MEEAYKEGRDQYNMRTQVEDKQDLLKGQEWSVLAYTKLKMDLQLSM